MFAQVYREPPVDGDEGVDESAGNLDNSREGVEDSGEDIDGSREPINIRREDVTDGGSKLMRRTLMTAGRGWIRISFARAGEGRGNQIEVDDYIPAAGDESGKVREQVCPK